MGHAELERFYEGVAAPERMINTALHSNMFYTPTLTSTARPILQKTATSNSFIFKMLTVIYSQTQLKCLERD
jgi:hypothetical protein